MILFATGGRVTPPFRVSGLEIRLDLGPGEGRAPDPEMPPDRLEAEGPAGREECGDLVLGEIVGEDARAPQARPLLDLETGLCAEILSREDAEVERPAGCGHARGLGGHLDAVDRAPVAQDVKEEDRVERPVGEREAPGIAADERERRPPCSRAAEGERGQGEVEADDGAGRIPERGKGPPVAAAELEHAGTGGERRKARVTPVEPAALPVVPVPAPVVHGEHSA
jgi:hypothetical protein